MLARFIRRKAPSFNVANYYAIYQFLPFPVTESSVETLNACGEAVRPASEQARVAESGRTAPRIVWDNCS